MSEYTISSSEASSFCNELAAPSLSKKNKSTTRRAAVAPQHVDACIGCNSDAATTPSKHAQAASGEAALGAMHYESPSMTIRRIPADCSQRMEEQKARITALERYKLLVKSARLVPSNSSQEATPELIKPPSSGDGRQKAADPTEAEAANPDDSKEEISPHSSSNRALFSEAESPAPPEIHRPESGQETAEPQEALTPFNSTPDSAILSRLDMSASKLCDVSPASCAATEEEPMEYFSPELTMPVAAPSRSRRESIRPDYEPVTAKGRRSHGLSARHGGDVDQGSGSSTTRGLSPRTGRSNSTPRRQSTAGGGAAAATLTELSAPKRSPIPAARAEAVEHSREATAAVSAVRCSREKSKRAAADAEVEVVTSDARVAIGAKSDEPTDVIPLQGSKRAFWVRPSSAMYEMTASIAAKRKDHPPSAYEESSNLTSGSRTPRGRDSAANGKPRFSTRLSSDDRRRMEEQSYDGIYSAHQSVARREVGGSRGKAAAGSSRGTMSRSSSVASMSTSRLNSPQRVSHRRTFDRQGSNSSLFNRRNSAAPSELSSAAVAPSLPRSGRVSTRQEMSFSNHCSRVSVTRATAADNAEETAKRKGRVPAKRIAPRRASTSLVSQSSDNIVEASPSTVSQKHAAEPSINKKLHFEVEGTPSAYSVVPQPAHWSSPAPRDNSPHTTAHGSRTASVAAENTPSKSHRRECDSTASPMRDDPEELAMEEAKVQRAKATLESCRRLMESRQAARESGMRPSIATSTNEVVAAMLQGIVQQRRRTIPCFLCAEQHSLSAYHVHTSTCRTRTESLLHDYNATTGNEVASRLASISEVAAMELPTTAASEEERHRFAKTSYLCAKALLVHCRKCGTSLRVHDLKEHELLCGKECYRQSRAAERVRTAAEHIEREAQQPGGNEEVS